MSETIQQLRKDHSNISTLLKLLDDEIESLEAGGNGDYVLMLDIMHYMTHYPDLFHHPKEDLVFEKLIERDPDVGSVVDDAVNEHQLLKDQGVELIRSLRNILNGFEPPHGRMQSQVHQFIATLRRHMEREETELFPKALKTLRDDDWSEIESAVESREDPVFGKVIKKEYLSLYEQIARP